MSELKRIDPKAIPALFEKHGMTPIQDAFGFIHDGKPCGCLNTLLAAEAVGCDAAISKARQLDSYDETPILGNLSGLDPDYALGLAEGWDGCVVCRGSSSESELIGMADGHIALEACEHLFAKRTPTQADRLTALGRHPSHSPFAMQRT